MQSKSFENCKLCEERCNNIESDLNKLDASYHKFREDIFRRVGKLETDHSILLTTVKGMSDSFNILSNSFCDLNKSVTSLSTDLNKSVNALTLSLSLMKQQVDQNSKLSWIILATVLSTILGVIIAKIFNLI